MRLLAVDANVTGRLVSALCSTLVYSLLQGIMLAVAAGLVVLGTRKQSAALRYNLLVSGLLIFAACTAATFMVQFNTVQLSADTRPLVEVLPASISPSYTSQPTAAAPVTGFSNLLAGYLNSHSYIIVLVWFLIICAKSIQLGVGLHGTYRLKRVNLFTVPYYWQARIQHFACALGITQHVRLLESGLAKVPLVIGHLKPVVLIPVGLLNALTPGEVEAILVHELAHIRRADFLVNLLQSLMEIVFFFNPAVLWVSQLIKTERENCCDDLALRQNSNTANYIRALLTCEEFRSAAGAHAMAFPGNSHGLLHRVKRVASKRNHSLSLLEKTLLSVCLVLSGLCVTIFIKKQPGVQVVAKVVKVPGDSITVKLQQVKQVATIALPTVADEKKGGNLKKAGVAKRREPQFTAGVSKKDSILQEVKIATTAGVNEPQYAADTTEPAPRYVYYAADSGRNNPAPSASDATWSNGRPQRPARPMYRPYHGYASPYGAYGAPQAPAGYGNNNGGYRGGHPPILTAAERQKQNDAMLHRIVDEMMREGVIVQKDNLVFKLSDTEFVVNGQKQSDAVFQQYKQEYVPASGNTGWTWTHSQHKPVKG